MKTTPSRSWILLSACLLAIPALSACSTPPRGSGSGDVDQTGGVALQIAPGLTLATASYTVSGPGGFTRSGTIDVSQSATLSAVLSGLPAGSGYSITISATLSDGTTTCMGSATFTVMARMTVSVTVHLLCREAARTGSATINGTINVCPVVDALSVNPAEAFVGAAVSLVGMAHDRDGVPAPLAYAWQTTSGLLGAATSANATLTCTAVGTATVTLTVSDGDCTDSLTATVTCSPGADTPPPIKINEVESSGGVPGDWIELRNNGSTPFDLSGYVVKDNDDTHVSTIPAGTTIAAGGYYVVEEAALGFGLGQPDSARLYRPGGLTLVDTYSWTTHAVGTTYGRCPDGTGDFVTTASVTKGAANDCGGGAGGAGGAAGAGGAGGAAGAGGAGGAAGAGGAGGTPAATLPWPGGSTILTVDPANLLGGNMSGLTYDPATSTSPAVLWAVKNGPGTLYKMVATSSGYAPATDDGWAAGKVLVYPNGTGGPDSEGVTKAELDSPAIYVATERDNNNNAISRLAVLRYDTSAAGTTLTATHEWNLTADLPVVGANLGLEAVTWIPDTYLVGVGFVDESTGLAYAPAAYPGHGTGLFFVGVENNGVIYAYALDHVGGGFHRVATVASGQVGVMGLEFDRDINRLWAYCDNTCGNKATVLNVSAGHFQISRVFDRPAGLPDANNEGFAIAPESECVGGLKNVWWADDGNTGGFAIRQGTMTCGAFPL